MDKPAKPPDRLNEQSAVSSAVRVQDPNEAEEQEEPGDWEELEEPGDWEELEEYRRLDEDLFWDESRPARRTGLCLIAGIGHAAVVKRTPNTSPDKPCQQLGHMLAWKYQRKRRRSANKPG
jgi:hypothetical protein